MEILDANSASIKACLCERNIQCIERVGAVLYAKRGNVHASFRDLHFASKFVGSKDLEYKAKFEVLSQFKQVDEVLPYLDSHLPEIQKAAKEFIEGYNKLNAFPHDHPEMKKHIEFVRWLKSHDSRLYKTRIAVYSKDFRGLHATVDIGKLQEIMSVPMSLTISAADLENTPIGKKLVEKQVFETKWAVFIFPLIYILEELDNPSSKHSVWLKTFPEDASEHPAFYSESELEWLRGSNMLNQLHYDKALIAQFYYTIASVYPDFAVRHTLRKFTMYYYLLCSRFFGINSYDPDRAFVVPYADLANTGLFAKRNAAWDYDSLRHHFRLFALAPIKAEEPVFIFEQPVHE